MKKPLTLKVLAAVGILIGSMSAMYAAFSARLFLLEEDQFVRLFQDELSATVSPSPIPSPSPSPSPAPSPSPQPKPAELAKKLYAQRGVVLPMAAMDFILSLLLLAGCLRALRGTLWGLGAWKLSCIAFLPYQALNLLHAIKLDELQPAYLAAWAVACSYYLISWWYLRRPQIAALFR